MKKLFLSILVAIASIATPLLSSAKTVTILPGDTLSAIAREHGTTVQSLVELNSIQNPNLIYPGATLEVDDVLGAAIPTVIADYSDSLATGISPSASSFTLVRGTDGQTRSLNGFYGFVLDEGSPKQEYMTANCVATACTIVTRGIDVVDGETSITALKKEHKRGASAKITNYPQLAILSRILSGLESASSTFSFGDGNTASSTNKCLKADNGTTNLPKICYNETLAKWQFSDDGISTITFATSSASGLSASTTKSVVFVDSMVAVTASSTRGIGQDTVAGTYNGYLYLKILESQGLKFDSSGNLQFDHAAALNLSGNVTSSGTFRVGSPVSANDAVPKIYTDNGLYFLPATTTADQTVTAGRALFATSTGLGAHTNTSAVSSTYQYIGLAITGGTNGQTVSYTRPGGINCSQSGLTPGADYFLNGTAGQISATPATNYVRIGRALTATCIQLDSPRMVIKGTATVSAAGTVTYQTGFYPSVVKIHATGVDGGSSYGDQNNYSTYCHPRSGVPYSVCGADGTNIYTTYNSTTGGASRSGTIVRNQYGFALTSADGPAPENVTIYWEATN